jgi:hypothetical protein
MIAVVPSAPRPSSTWRPICARVAAMFTIVFEGLFWGKHGWTGRLHAFTYHTRALAEAALAKLPDTGARVVSA